tara:strand:- start:11894 stop:12004 length:111 start_codon:yes stop_codon:yes gene_type:complete
MNESKHMPNRLQDVVKAQMQELSLSVRQNGTLQEVQ